MANTTRLLDHFLVKLNGDYAPIDFARAVSEITVESSLHLPDVATVVLHDAKLRWIDDNRLAPGTPLDVLARTVDAPTPIFHGEIIEIEPDFGSVTHYLVVRAFDRLHRLARGRKVYSHRNTTDSDIATKIAQAAGLQPQVEATRQVHEYVLQANETDLEFLRRRAAALGYVVYVHGETLHFEPPKPNGRTIELAWGAGLGEFRPRLTTVDQVTGVTVRGWDPGRKEAIVGEAKAGRGVPQVGADRNGGKLAQDAFKREAPQLVTDRPIRTQAQADLLAQATADYHAARYIEAEGACGGNPDILAGTTLQISRVGKRFSGTYVVTGATHRYTARDGYATQFTISSLNPATLLTLLLAEQEERRMSGLVIGIVTDNQDPEGLGRVKVKYPWLSEEHGSDWVRVAAVGGGNKRGIEFIPEVNDEVLIGFEHGDMHFPYVLGGLWNGKDKLPRDNREIVHRDGKVQQRIIRSRTGHTIILDDSDAESSVTVTDKEGNYIKLDSRKKAMTLRSKGSLTLHADQNVTIKSEAGTVDVSGTVINLN